MEKLQLPEYSFRIKSIENNPYIFDPVRKKYVMLLPEEWVRQNFIQYLVQEKGVPISLVGVEQRVKVNRLLKRTDIVVYERNGKPLCIVECKSPATPLTQKSFDQIARYNIPLKTMLLIVTNGLKHYACKIHFEEEDYTFLQEIPTYGQMLQMSEFS